ncbi:ATP-binding protein [Marinactinospora thermotolerans]|uniref:Anti-sigma regulatory factor (Ser/Thr protein kinase) n=1 Tax=Marinactinospora thermotolerans DSM 45154 TaxID=1122192 RepID=A0A1T4RRZ5_9ACTN|nr:ATP-binding protein [Marinactinospora thermotolerans]SKA18421.1 Anti-sigma regulatory factor (Ser/Thr protein kinase) [Marinactinospora thermotolerans DSM 45154]
MHPVVLEAVLEADSPQPWWLPSLRNGTFRWDTRPGHASHDSASWTLSRGSGSVHAARELAMAVLREWSMARLSGDVELVVSELVTNALRHAQAMTPAAPGYENVIQLAMLRRGGELVCAVRDGSDRLPAQREPDFLAETGRGLHLVSCFSRSWGSVPVASGGKFVWALFT